MSKHTSGPWQRFRYRVGATKWGKTICDTANNKASRTAENEWNAELIAQAPAMELALLMIQFGCARIELACPGGTLYEFCFEGLRYCLNGDWNALMDTIGWKNARAAVAKFDTAF